MKVTVLERGDSRRKESTVTLSKLHNWAKGLSDEVRPLCQVFLDELEGQAIQSPFMQLTQQQMEGLLSQCAGLYRQRESDVGVSLFDVEGVATFLATTSVDVPYLVDSLQTLLRDLEIGFQTVFHPIFSPIDVPSQNRKRAESFILVALDPLTEELMVDVQKEVILSLNTVIDTDACQVALRDRLTSVMQTEKNEAVFVSWLLDGNFLPLGYKSFQLQKNEQNLIVDARNESSIGADFSGEIDATGGDVASLSTAFHRRLERDCSMVVESIDYSSPVLRRDAVSYVGFRSNQDAKETEHAFYGLFLPKALNEPTSDVPCLASRITTALDRVGIKDGSHDYSKVIEIFDDFPKVDLFFLEEVELDELIRSFVSLQRHGMVKVVVTRSLSRSSLTLMLIMPQEFYNVDVVERLEEYLCRFIGSPYAEIKIIHSYSDFISAHVRMIPDADELVIDIDLLENGLTALLRPWKIRLRKILCRLYGDEGRKLWDKYRNAFSQEYLTSIYPRFAIRDIRGIEDLLAHGRDVFSLWGPFGGDRNSFYRLQFYSEHQVNLNKIMPFLENLNLKVLREVDFPITVDGRVLYIKSFDINGPSTGESLVAIKDNLLGALHDLWSGELENDYLNLLLPLTGLTGREIDVFRAYRSYYFQLGTPFTKRRVAFALVHYPNIAKLLFTYFKVRFTPETKGEIDREEGLMQVRLDLAAELEQVEDINEDLILRTFFNLIDSTVRTNFFRRIGEDKYWFSFKISAIGIIDMPAPRPLFEIYVHSAHIEGIHLRGGPVARGGLRWSERPDDFRTEVLGLMKTQMTKNALIVPVGSKGGFVVKHLPSDQKKRQEAVLAGYRTFIRGLLDLTDNRSGADITPPEAVVCYDPVDPYLVVAADKGTATFSDVANAISDDYNFWLSDAFASGGSNGYDHKKLGITAKGAWEAVSCHFREMGLDIQKDRISAVGIGDMSGDVFGNGMLLSEVICLKAAFNHRHIFLDPDPDPAKSFVERRRLFDLPRSSWDDYDRNCISSGGGVFFRADKDIPLSAEVKRWLGVRHDSLDGDSLIRAILRAEVDLLWNGGIGTYFKSSVEKHDDAGDKANDNVRIDAPELKAKVIGEGGNLGFTQLARIEYALKGGGINTDAIDNSAGVDCSDHEVNLKILMQYLHSEGIVNSSAERDTLLQSYTDDVCHAVLQNNYAQCTSLSLDQQRAQANLDPFFDTIRRLGDVGLLDRKGEFLPSQREVTQRSTPQLTRPELSIITSYSKMHLFQSLLEDGVAHDTQFLPFLSAYFPVSLVAQFGDVIQNHPLAPEIIATMMTNYIVDRTGSSLIHRIVLSSGAGLSTVAKMWTTLDSICQFESLRKELNALDYKITAEDKYRLLITMEESLADMTAWCIDQHIEVDVIKSEIERLAEGFRTYLCAVYASIVDDERINIDQTTELLTAQGVKEEAARNIALSGYSSYFMAVQQLTVRVDKELYFVAGNYAEISQYFLIREVIDLMSLVQVRDHWDRDSVRLLDQGFESALYRITKKVLINFDGNLERFLAKKRREMKRYFTMLEEVKKSQHINLHPFASLLNRLNNIIERENVE